MASNYLEAVTETIRNYKKILKRDWLSPAQFEYEQDSVCVMLVNGQSKRTVNMSCLYKWTECFMCVHCCFTFHPVNCFFFLQKRTTNV